MINYGLRRIVFFLFLTGKGLVMGKDQMRHGPGFKVVVGGSFLVRLSSGVTIEVFNGRCAVSVDYIFIFAKGSSKDFRYDINLVLQVEGISGKIWWKNPKKKAA